MSLLQPWVQDHLIEIAEQYGADLFSVPSHPKWKIVQIFEFLHTGTGEKVANVWARVSDSIQLVTVKFTPEASEEYLMVTRNVRLTECKAALIRIRNFKPFLGRVPTSGNRMTKEPTLVLECTSAKPAGSYSEERIGSPKDVSTNPDIRVWITGLKKDGGAGNILKEKRTERDKHQANQIKDSAPAQILEQQRLDDTLCKPAMKPVPRSRLRNTGAVDCLKAYHQSWRTRNSSFDVPSEIVVALKALPIETKEESIQSVLLDEDIKSPRKRRRLDANTDEDSDGGSQPFSDWPASSDEERPPTPEQRPLTSPLHSLGSFAGTQNSGERGSAPQCFPSPAFHKMIPSSPMVPPLSSPGLPSELPLYASQHPRSRVTRKVPPPKQPHELALSSGPERVLVPASDTSVSQSQSQSQSHSQRQVGGAQRAAIPDNVLTGLPDQRQYSRRRGPGQVSPTSTYVLQAKTTKQDWSRQVARKIVSSEWEPGRTSISSNSDNEVGTSESEEEINKRPPDKREKLNGPDVAGKHRKTGMLPPSKRDSIDNHRASPNGSRPSPISTPNDGLPQVDTPVQHDPGAWSEPSFMREKKRERGPKLGGFTVDVNGLRKGEHEHVSWLGWRELDRILVGVIEHEER